MKKTLALILAVSMPADKGFETRVGDPSAEELKNLTLFSFAKSKIF